MVNKKVINAMSIIFILQLILVSCLTTPKAKITQDSFTGKTWVTQEPFYIGWNTFGFGLKWTELEEKNVDSDLAILTAALGLKIENISGCAFNIDGEIINLVEVDSTTNYEGYIYNQGARIKASTRKFSVSLAKLRDIAQSDNVKFRITRLNKGSVVADLDDSAKQKVSKFLMKIEEVQNNM